ncbi:MAG: hypothetical protein ACI9XK_003411 [Granulosicoccus sp.]|jgi:hypothetical protein
MFGGREILSKVILSNVLEVSRMAEKPVAALKRNNDHYPAGLIRLKKWRLSNSQNSSNSRLRCG